ncbi:MAG: glycosyltransferase [Spirochaetales bacterium]|nr:glycosyltransferase [Spirochaetales bacterium]
MNIGFFADCWDPQINGVITSMKNLELDLCGKNHRVYKFAPKQDNSHNDQTLFLQNSIQYVFQKEFSLASPFPYKALDQARKWKLDIVHGHSEFSVGRIGATVADRLNIPLVATLHTLWELYTHYFFWGKCPLSIFRYYFGMYYRRPRYFIVPSIKIKKYLQTVFHVEHPIEIIPTGIELSRFGDSQYARQDISGFRKQFRLKDNDIVGILVGRMGKEKSIEMVIRAVARLIHKYPKLKLLLVGGGPELEELKALAKTLDAEDAVVFAGYIPQKNIPLTYRASDFFITASTTETQGLSTIEAMATGLPLILRSDPVQKEVAGDSGNALFFDSEMELANAMEKIISNTTIQRQLASLAKKRSESFSLAQFGSRVERFYDYVLTDFHSSRIK